MPTPLNVVSVAPPIPSESRIVVPWTVKKLKYQYCCADVVAIEFGTAVGDAVGDATGLAPLAGAVGLTVGDAVGDAPAEPLGTGVEGTGVMLGQGWAC